MPLLRSLSVAELATISTLQRLPGLSTTDAAGLQRLLAQLIHAWNTVNRSHLDIHCALELEVPRLMEGVHRAQDMGMRLMSALEVSVPDYLDANGQWKWQDIHEPASVVGDESLHAYFDRPVRFTREQQRILHLIMAEPGESLDVQGFAGTGKTRLIAQLVQMTDAPKILLCAMTRQKLSALQDRVCASGDMARTCDFRTFGQVAWELLTTNQSQRWRFDPQRARYRYHLTAKEIAAKAQIEPLGNWSGERVAWIAQEIVNVFCRSVDDRIRLRHLAATGIPTPQAHSSVLLALAARLWDLIAMPDRADPRPMPLRPHHVTKLVALSGARFPDRYSHVLFDEAHNLPAPVVAILDRSPQASISFRDNYQSFAVNLKRRRSRVVRHRGMAQSFRAGTDVEPLYNDILHRHPSPPEVEFRGAFELSTSICYYDQFEISTRPCAILCKDIWNVFNIIQRLTAASAPCSVLPESLADVGHLISESIDLYHGRLETATHHQLRSYRSWNAFRTTHDTVLFDQLEHLFKRGYDQAQLRETIEKCRPPDTDTFIVGRIQDASNREFPRVMLMRDALRLDRHDPESMARTVNTLYTGISRAQNELIIPGELRDWVSSELAVQVSS